MLLLPIDFFLRRPGGAGLRWKNAEMQTRSDVRFPLLLSLIAGLGVILLTLASPRHSSAQAPSPPYITFPQDGGTLQGTVEITGSTDVVGFTSYTLDFTYQADETRTWFEIQSSAQSVAGGPLARWDTSQITDGDYRLRLRVFAAGSEPKRFIVQNVHVRNYTPADTSTPTLSPTATITPTPTATATLAPTATATAYPTPSPLPPNPAEVTPVQIGSYVARGGLAAIALFAIFGLFVRLRRS
jgi:hypothetical protein